MYRSFIAVFFVSLFMVMIITPSVVTLLDLDYDIAVLIDSSEEEEKEGKESAKDKDVKILQVFKNGNRDIDSYLSAHPRFYSNTYKSNYLELISPPPEHIPTT